MSDEKTLLPCPFCGGEARHYAPGPIDHHIECVECYADIHRDTEAEAIAAWNTRAELGSERIAELEAENERLRKAGYEIGYHDAMKAAKRGGTLTAEQVSKATYAHSIHADCADADWQAIADELNAELGNGTCRIEERNGDWYCDACGEMVGTCDPASELYIDGNAVELWNYCPNCGRRVMSA